MDSEILQSLIKTLQELDFTEQTIQVIIFLIPLVVGLSPVVLIKLVISFIKKHSVGF